MAEQPPPWGERTLEVTPQDPWADPPTSPTTARLPAPEAPRPTPPMPAVEPPHAFSRGVAHVKPALPRTEPFTAAHEPTGTGWPGAEPPRLTWGAQLRGLRRGGEWSSAAVMFAFLCWGVWKISGGGSWSTAVVILVVTLVVALGLFALARMVGRVVLEKQFGRVRRTARGAHLVSAAFLTGVGLAQLHQVTWVMTAWHWLIGLA